MPNEEMGSRRVPEPAGVADRVVLASVSGFLAFVIASMAALFFYLHATAPGAFLHPVARTFPAPALQTRPQDDLAAFARTQRRSLAEYAWVDRGKGIARIPIGEAMRLVVARGSRAYDAPASAPSSPAGPDERQP